MVIGRDLRCEIALDASLYRSVSRRHAEILPILGFESPQGERFWQVCDLNSSNGTFVNGDRLQECQVLQVGDSHHAGAKWPRATV